MRLTIAPVGGYFVVLAVAIALLALVWLLPARRRVSGARQRALTILRAAIIVMLLLAMLRPTLVYTDTKKQAATLVLLADRSRSMQVADETGGRTRWETMRKALIDLRTDLTELSREMEVKLLAFDDQLRPLDVAKADLGLGDQPEGRETAMGSALEEVLRQEAGKRLVGVLLLGDGAQRAVPPKDLAPQIPARRMAQLGAPLFGVPFGKTDPGQARDVALEDLHATERVFVKNQLVVDGMARINGYVNQPMPVQMFLETKPGEMEQVAGSSIEALADGARLAIALNYVPEVPGEFKLTLKVPPQPSELVTTNNELSTFITVLKGGLNVLYIEGALRVEQKFLRRSLDASPDVKVDYLQIDAQKPETRPSDLVERFQPGKYDVYILGDIDSSAFELAELEALRQAVERGAGLLMLGGFHSFGPGGYGQTPLADVLPVEMTSLERQNFGEALRDDVHVVGSLRLQPTPEAERRGLMLLASAEQNASAWSKLPALEGANRLGRVKPTGVVLLISDSGDPVLVAQGFGIGRAMAFAGDSTWQWWMQGHDAEHRRFWRQMVLWLARKEQSSDTQVWVELDQRRYNPGARVDFAFGATTPEGEPIEGAIFTTEVVHPDGRRTPARVLRRGEQSQGSFLETFAAGDYAIEVSGTSGGEPLGQTRVRFLVHEQDLEMENAAADRAALESLSLTTQGRMLAPEQLPALFDELKKQSIDARVEVQTKRSLWDNAWFMLAFVGLLTAEWYLRKKWGLV